MGASASVLVGKLTYATPGTSVERQRFGTPWPRNDPQLRHRIYFSGEWPWGPQPHRPSASELAAGGKTPRSLPFAEWITLDSSVGLRLYR